MNPPPEFQPGQILPEEVVRQWLKSCGQDPKIYRGCRILQPERVAVGDYVQIDEGVFILGGQGVSIGNHVHLAACCSVSGGGECIIEDFAGVSFGVRLVTGSELADGSGLTNPTIPSDLRAVRRGKIVVGAHAVVFTNAVVFPDVSIGEGAVVAAGGLVHHDLKPWGIYAGNPLVQVGVRPSQKVMEAAESVKRKG